MQRETFRCGDADVCSKSCVARRMEHLQNIDPTLTRPDTWVPEGSQPPPLSATGGGNTQYQQGTATARSMKRTDSKAALAPGEIYDEPRTKNGSHMAGLCCIIVMALLFIQYFE